MKIVAFCLFSVLIFAPSMVISLDNKVYIVYLGQHDGKKRFHEIKQTHHSYLQSVKQSKRDAKSSLLYSYKHSINGFAAKLTSDEASKLSRMDNVLSVFPSREYKTHTTRSWDFVGLNDHSNIRVQMGDDLLSNSHYGQNQIIGVVDSGVWPESPSFSDEGMDPVPKSWNGICEEGTAFNKSHCNRKIIGARYYSRGFKNYYGSIYSNEDFLSPRDPAGHGSHTASIAAGRLVRDASLPGGVAKGTATGGAPMARLAIYKACWKVPDGDIPSCMGEDLLAAIDDAIGDGVDILSISVGLFDQPSLDQDSIAIGSLHAASRNIVTVCSAGNSGPSTQTVSNTAPWIITVAANTIDREFYSPVLLGNGVKIYGCSIAPYSMDSMYQLVYAGDVALPGVSVDLAIQCQAGTLDPDQVNGKIVLCLRGEGASLDEGIEVNRAGGVGLILSNGQSDGDMIPYDPHFICTTGVTYDNAGLIHKYIMSTTYATATIVPVQSITTSPAPIMAPFSSRGPNYIDPYILKPDITAPGVEILAAWSEASSITGYSYDQRSVKYNLDSGTSMACPHVSGVVALLRAVHPDWSLSAIKSALMTTASIIDDTNEGILDYNSSPATPFAFGAGHFQPIKATDPGLVYDSSYNDYLLYLCTISPGLLNTLNSRVNCPDQLASSLSLNYPSFATVLYDSVTITRTVTNVCHCSSTYVFSWQLPAGVGVEVEPRSLSFDRYGESRSFTMTYYRTNEYVELYDDYVFGWYMWNDGQHYVRSPFAIQISSY